MTRVAVVGTTSWGTTLAVLFARNGHETLLLARGSDEAAQLQSARSNERHRPGLPFPKSLTVAADAAVLQAGDLIVLAVPSKTLGANLESIVRNLAPDATLLSATKGIDVTSCRRMSQVIEDRGIAPDRILALSGPNFASEIAAGLPAATLVAGRDPTRTRIVQELLNGPTFRVYTSDDIVGVETAGALKNVVAIACGLSDGLGYGENAKAGLITRALAEITRLGVAGSANPLTFLGLAGIGDLVLTCQSDLSRNRRFGLALAAGAGFDAALASVNGVVEGAETARCVPALASRWGVELPVCSALYSVLYEGRPAAEAGRELMSRAAGAEL